MIYSNDGCTIIIEKLNIFGYHGIFEEEQKFGQNFNLNFILDFNLEKFNNCDDIDKTIDFNYFCNFINQIFNMHKFKTLEALDNFITKKILLKFENLKFVETIIYKEKPLFKCLNKPKIAKIKLKKSWHRAYLSLGSNLGNKQQNLNSAINLIKARKEIKNVEVSKIIETKSYGTEMANFLNCAIELETFMNPFELLEICNDIELQLGRVRLKKWEPRIIDIDVLFFDDIVLSTKKLTIPHYDIKNRYFVLKPMMELNPNLIHPIYLKTITELLNQLNNKTNLV